MNGTSEVEEAEELISKIMFLLSVPAQRLATALKRSLATEPLEVACAGKSCTAKLRLPKGVKLSGPNSRYLCKECCRDRSILDTTKIEIEKVFDGKSLGQKRMIYEVLASTRASRGLYIVEYPNRRFGYSEGGYKPYRRKKVQETARDWRKNNKEWQAEYKRLYRLGHRSRARRGQRSKDTRKERATDSNAAWTAKLEQFGFACSSCGGTLTIKTAIRWREGATHLPVCASCLGKKAAEARWNKAKRWKKAS
jgi:transposase-like protein